MHQKMMQTETTSKFRATYLVRKIGFEGCRGEPFSFEQFFEKSSRNKSIL